MSLLAPIAYARREAPTRTFRSVEYDLLAQVTRRMRAAWANREGDFPSLVHALAENERLWSTLAADIALPGNGLPAPLRAKLFYLYEFTTHHSRAIMAGKGSVEVLADLNTAVMRGLRGEGGAG
jgi:flagellar biosynthesis activator protein FlaF